MQPKYIKPTEYAKIMSMHPLTVRQHFHKGLIPGKQDPKTGTIKLINPLYKDSNQETGKKAILYARVSSTTNKQSLQEQLSRLESYALAKGYTIVDEVTEIASGLNDHRPKFIKLLKRDDYNILLAEHKDRVTRFGFNYLSVLLNRLGITLEVVNQSNNKDNELMEDFISLVTSFCNRIYGRRKKDKTKQIIQDLQNENQKKTSSN